jgi:hypothetical protein
MRYLSATVTLAFSQVVSRPAPFQDAHDEETLNCSSPLKKLSMGFKALGFVV